MAQADGIVSNASGAAVRADLNNQLAALFTNHSGATEPSTTYAYQWWADTTAGQLKLRNGSNDGWVTIQELDGTLLMEDGTVGAPGLAFASDLDTGFYRSAPNELGIATGGTNAIYIDNAQQVGIGTTSPSQLLHLESDAPRIRLIDTDDSTGGQISSAGGNLSLTYDINGVGSRALTFNDNSGEKARIDSSGRLLLNTTSSRDQYNNTTGQAPRLQVETIAGEPSNAIGIVRNSNNGTGSVFVLAKSRGTTAGSATIVSSGDTIGIVEFQGADGTDLVSAATIKAQVDGTSGANDMPGRLVFSTTADGAASPTERMKITNDGILYSAPTYNNTTADTANMFVSASGQFYRSTSSLKYKTDVETLQDSYADAILNIRPVWYRSTCDGDCPEHSYWGFIAEEVAAVDSRLVQWKTVDVTYDEKGSAVETPCDPEPDGVAYERFVPHLLNLIKRQKEQIEAMEARLSALEAQ